jgi:hypothetical protein
MHHRQQLSDEDRDRRRAQDRERLRQAAEQLLSSEGWQRWVRARASNGLARYSLTNQLLVALQSGGRATFVAGFKQWLELGYCVRKGERAIRIMAPMTVKERDRQTGEETGETITLFKSVAVFFQDQVDPLPSGEPVPLEPPREPLTGDSHAPLAPARAGVLRVARLLGLVRDDRRACRWLVRRAGQADRRRRSDAAQRPAADARARVRARARNRL